MDTYKTTFIVHAQEGFHFQKHPDFKNIGKYVKEDSFQIYHKPTGNISFPTSHMLESSHNGTFNNKHLDQHARDIGINTSIPHNVEMTMVGGELEACLQTAFYETKKWMLKTLGNKKVILPKDAVFSYGKTKTPLTLGELYSNYMNILNEILAGGYVQYIPCKVIDSEENIMFEYPNENGAYFNL